MTQLLKLLQKAQSAEQKSQDYTSARVDEHIDESDHINVSTNASDFMGSAGTHDNAGVGRVRSPKLLSSCKFTNMLLLTLSYNL